MEASKYPAYQDFEWAVKLNRYSLELIGLWPKFEQTTREKYMSNLRVLFVFSLLMLVIVIPAIHSLIRVRSNIMIVIDNLQFILPIITSVLRLVIFWWKKEAITPLIRMIANDWVKLKTPDERTTMIARAQTARIIITLGYSIMGAALAVAIILPIFGYSMRYITNITDPGRLLPLQTYYIYDVTKSPQYELTFIFQSIAMFFCIMPYTGIDNFLSLLVFHICGQLDILKNRLVRIKNVTNYVNVLKSCAMDHARLLSAIAIIEDTFNAMLLMLFLYFGGLFAFHGFYTMTLFEEHSISLSHLAYLVTIVTNTFGHMCVYCAVGEILTAQCNQIHYAVYCNEWYNLNPRNARDLALLMVRTNKPFYLTAGKVFTLTMATFCNLLKTSAGYISVMLTTRS
ncbi:odorant receptor 33a-like isoform X2 [Linepithema humile]|uniref:odorant receptor 33a-like isoform X2 n=1 Tax=Linepithema humile TaxID=83485 RepID=UPI00351F5CF1